MTDWDTAASPREPDIAAMLREQEQRMRDLQQRLQVIECTATSPRRTVSVTVGHGGAIRDMTFHGSGYKRMAPKELSDMILATIGQAQNDAQLASAEILSESMGGQVDMSRLVRGDVELTDLLPRMSTLRQMGLLPESGLGSRS